jgi:protein-ribulosamine 3-kinase
MEPGNSPGFVFLYLYDQDRMNTFESQVVNKALAELSDKKGIQITLQNIRPLGGGCINHAALLETSADMFFLKWNRDCPADMFVREAESLLELKKAAPPILVIPEVLVAAEAAELPGFLLLEYLESGNSRNSEEELGTGLALLHQFESSRFGFYHDNYCGSTPQRNTWSDSWGQFFAVQKIGVLLDCLKSHNMFSFSELRIFENLIQKIPSLLADKSKPVLIHGDLWSGNYMITSRGPALIDPASYYADREMEFGIMTLFGGFSARFREAYNEVNPLPSGWKERNKLYQLYHVLNHYLLFGGGYGRQAVELARYYF